MEFKQSLAQRIIIAFALMSALVAGAFAMGIVATVHLVEEKLISAGLGGDLQRLLLMDSVSDWSHRPEPDQLFYFSGGKGDFELPKDLRHLDSGFHEVFREHLSYHAMVEIVDGRRYVLLQDQSDFEERERVLFAVVLVGFVLKPGAGGISRLDPGAQSHGACGAAGPSGAPPRSVAGFGATTGAGLRRR